ncbi:translocation/assembly module TamB domain-containing protein [Tabrizicola sp. J26]|uniref:translocation/assembly module TamB domain-containing protein n=1 Tax=Alitabrizicola rongguiensis TaxID=2909234 RepID=UPI001F2CDF3B|nr:translocation/assembly module TamB domain-containing protein [Tabrizicola rongguiensis]MCF1708158.1 translocation/assembly module TamB domain-containing protein [Tabrizicola rongguiensis]
MQQLTIADSEGVWLTLNDVTLDWNRAAVLRGNISVNELTAQEIVVARRPVSEPSRPSPEASGFSLPELPVSIDIAKLGVARLELDEPVLGTALEATLNASMKLTGGEGQTDLSLMRTDAGPKTIIRLKASYANSTRLLSLDLDAQEAAGGLVATRLGLPGAPATEFFVKGDGRIDNFAADIRLATDSVNRLTGKITLQSPQGGDSAFTASLGGDPVPLFLPEYADFFGHDVSLNLAGTRATSGALDLSQLSVRTKAMTIDGNLALGSDGLPERFSLQGQIAHDDGSIVVLPVGGGSPPSLRKADLTLRFDPAVDEGWRGQATVAGFAQPAIAIDQLMLTGSGRIGRGPAGNTVGATLSLIASGIKAKDPGLNQALGGATTGQIKLAWQEGQPLRLSNLTLAGSDYTLKTQGRIGGLDAGISLDGALQADLRDLTRFSGLAGRPLGGAAILHADGNGSLLGGNFDVTGTLSGTALRIGIPEVDNLLAGTSAIDFSVARDGSGTAIRQFDLAAANLSVRSSGELKSSGSDLTADLAFDDLRTLGAPYRGALKGQARWTGTLDNGRATLTAQASNLGIGEPTADRVLAGATALNIDMRTVNGTPRLDGLKLSNPQVAVNVTQAKGDTPRRLNVDGRLKDLALLLPEFPGPATVSGTITERPDGYAVDLGAKGPGQIDAGVTGTVAQRFDRADLALRGTAQSALANPFITPRTVAGPLSFDMRLKGPLALRSLSGRISLANGRVSAPLLRFIVEGISAQADLAGGRAKIEASGRINAGGQITASGTVGLEPPFQSDLAIALREAVLRDPELYEVRVNGDVRVTGPLTGGGSISGRLFLPETEIRVPNGSIAGTAEIPDLQHVNEPTAVRATRERAGLVAGPGDRGRSGSTRPFAMDVTIDAPNRVFVRGRGLDAELGGSIRLGGTTANLVPSGRIGLIRGRFDILGRRLDLTEAELTLEGDFNPQLRVVASTSGDGITSSVVLEGRISEPTVTFTSSPELPQEEVLAHLLFGRDLTSLSPFQAAQLAGAVATLAGRGGEGILGSLRRGFGLDDLDVGSDSTGGTSLKIGRYLSDRIYTDVAVGSKGTTELNLNLDLGRGVTIRGSADSEGDTSLGMFVDRSY